MDAVSAGTVVAWAMECFERGILTKDDFDGLEPHFGNADAGITLLEKIARREGIGDAVGRGHEACRREVGPGFTGLCHAGQGHGDGRLRPAQPQDHGPELRHRHTRRLPQPLAGIRPGYAEHGGPFRGWSRARPHPGGSGGQGRGLRLHGPLQVYPRRLRGLL